MYNRKIVRYKTVLTTSFIFEPGKMATSHKVVETPYYGG